MEQIKELIARTIALRSIVKDIHYQALLEQKWDTHKQMDEIYEGTDDWFDNIQEVIVVPVFNEFVKSKDYLDDSKKYCFDFINTTEGKEKLVEFLADFIDLLTKINKTADLGTQNLVSGFSQSIQQFIGWINLIKNKE